MRPVSQGGEQQKEVTRIIRSPGCSCQQLGFIPVKGNSSPQPWPTTRMGLPLPVEEDRMFWFRPVPSRQGVLLILAALTCLGIAGCRSGPKLYPVKGKVVFKDDGKPVTGGTILFESV